MTDYNAFVGQLEDQIKEWQKQASEIQEKMQGSSGSAEDQYKEQMKTMEETIANAIKMQTDLQRANEAAWTDLSRGAAHAFEDWQRAWAVALSRYK